MSLMKYTACIITFRDLSLAVDCVIQFTVQNSTITDTITDKIELVEMNNIKNALQFFVILILLCMF